MVIYEELENEIIKAYSDQGMLILGGQPEGFYVEAFDPKSAHRVYVETDIPISPEDPEEEEDQEQDEGQEDPEQEQDEQEQEGNE